MDEEYWLKILRGKKYKSHKNKDNRDSFFEYMFIYSGKINVVFVQNTPVMAKRGE